MTISNVYIPNQPLGAAERVRAWAPQFGASCSFIRVLGLKTDFTEQAGSSTLHACFVKLE